MTKSQAKKAMELMNEGNEEFEEKQPRAVFEGDENEGDYEEKEELNNTKTLMDLDISTKLKKLMSSLKKSGGKPITSEKKVPSRTLNSERIRFDKNFKHFLKMKKKEFLQILENSFRD